MAKDDAESPVEAVPAAEAPEVPAEAVEAATEAPDPVDVHAYLNPNDGPVSATIHAWVYANLAGGPIGRQTEIWNTLWAALPALRDMIEKGT
jgi:hypothetical protein